MPNSGRVTPSQLEDIVTRLQTPTAASRSWTCQYDPQDTHIQYLKQKDPKVHPKKTVYEKELGQVVHRLTKPTVASRAAEFCFDNQDANLQYLQKLDPRIHPNRSPKSYSVMESPLPPRSPLLSQRSIEGLPIQRSTTPLSRKSPDMPWVPGLERTYMGYRTVNSSELNKIVKRVSKPTVSSEGGAKLVNKKYDYIIQPNLKTMPAIKGLDTRYLGHKKVNEDELDRVINRLHSPTKAMVSRSVLTPSPHVWEEYQPDYYHTLKKKNARCVSSMI